MTATDVMLADLPVLLPDGRRVSVPVFRAPGRSARIGIHYGKIYGYVGNKVPVRTGLESVEKLVRGLRGLSAMAFVPMLDWENRTVYFLGRKRSITNNVFLRKDPGFFYLPRNEKFATAFDRECRGYALVRVREEAKRGEIDLTDSLRVRIGNYRTKHASFRKKDWLFEFDRRLFAFAPEVIDSVVDHELSHTKELNHSIRFYGILFSLCPRERYKECRKIIDEGRFWDVPKENR